MAVHLNTKQSTFLIGSGSFLGSFFDTIEYRLTRGFWGKKYPVVLGEFYQGKLSYQHLDAAAQELRDIQKRLKKFKPSKVVWDKLDLSKKPPWGNNISPAITSLANYYLTSDGKDLFQVLFEAIETAKVEKSDLRIG